MVGSKNGEQLQECIMWMSLSLKGKFNWSAIRPALVYGSKCSAFQKSYSRKIKVVEMQMFWWMIRHTLKDRIRNEIIRMV